MEARIHFSAPWGRLLVIMTSLITIVMLWIIGVGLFAESEPSLVWYLMMIGLPLSILLGASLFMIRGYELGRNDLIIKRFFWNSRIDFKSLISIERDPDAMTGSICTFGNGGFFSFSGRFRNTQLGSYRAFATDPKRAVVIKTEKRTFVITPQDPDDFILKCKEFSGILNE